MKKILRDIQKKDSLVIALETKRVKAPKRKSEHVLDLSGLDRNKMVITKTVQPPSEKKEIFLTVDDEPRRPFNRISELVRLAAAGTLILFLLNGINIYHHGQIIQERIVASAFEGYSGLLAAGDEAKNKHLNAAGDAFAQANLSFENALNEINFLESNQDLFFTHEKTVQSVQGILGAGKNIAEAGKDFARGIENLRNLPQLIVKENNENEPQHVTIKLKEDLEFINKATAEVEVANDQLFLVDSNVLPVQFQEKFKSAKSKVQKLLDVLFLTQEKIPVFLKLLGDRYPHRYLVLLQNDTEARPTGGFIGSYLIIDFNDGYLTKMEFHDVYDSDGQFKEEIPAPEDIAKVSKNWRLRDSNYSPDFAISGEKAAWFLQKEKGPSVDTVIAVNQHFLADLFDITGPLTLDGLNAPFTKENYQMMLSYIIESKLDGEEDPKKILRQFIPAFQQKLLNSEAFEKTFTALLKGLREKDILLYSRDEEIQKLFDDMGLSGHVLRTQHPEDYLNVITTSIGGNKSDLYIKQNLKHTTVITEKGEVKNELTITREHQWNEQSLAYLRENIKKFGFSELSDSVKFILGAGENKSIIKVYVPMGSALLNANGIDVNQVAVREDIDLQKTYFMFEMDTAPGKSSSVTISYQLPQNLDMTIADSYKMFVQRQPGITTSHFEKNIFLKPELSFYQTYPEELVKNQNGQATFEQDLGKDLYLSALVGK